MDERDVDLRFREIMAAEFGSGSDSAAGSGEADPDGRTIDHDTPAVRRDPRGTRRTGADRSGVADLDGVMELPSQPVGTPPPAASRRTPQQSDDFNFTEAMAEADPTPDEGDRFVPENPPPMTPWRMPVAIGATLMAGGLVITLLELFGATLSRPMAVTGVLAAVVGLAVLLSNAPRGSRDPWDDGARL